MQIFAFTECPDFHALLEVECKEITGVRPVIHGSVADLKSILEIFPIIDSLIIDVPDEEDKIHELKEFLLSNSSRVSKAFVLGNESGTTGNVRLFTRMEIVDLFEELKSYCLPDEGAQTGWTAIPLCTLIHFESTPFDLYIRLSDRRYVKRINAYEEIAPELLSSLAQKGVKELFCEKKYNRDFSMMLINNMINKVDRNYDSFMDQLKAHGEVYSTAKEIIQDIGFSGRVIEVCESAIEKMCLDVLGGPDQFSAYLLAMKNEKEMAFHFKLVTLTNYIGTQLILDMKLPRIDEQVKKFIYASFFCDMTLKDPAFHFHRNAESSAHLSLEEKNQINFHALRASELVASYRNTPKEVGLIIRQHHGSFSGIGFPLEKSNQLLPLSKVLIVSQDLAFTILTKGEAPVLETLKGFLRKHKTSALNDLIETLEAGLRDQLIRTA